MRFLNVYSNWSQFNPCHKNDQNKKHFPAYVKILLFPRHKIETGNAFYFEKIYVFNITNYKKKTCTYIKCVVIVLVTVSCQLFPSNYAKVLYTI